MYEHQQQQQQQSPNGNTGSGSYPKPGMLPPPPTYYETASSGVACPTYGHPNMLPQQQQQQQQQSWQNQQPPSGLPQPSYCTNGGLAPALLDDLTQPPISSTAAAHANADGADSTGFALEAKATPGKAGGGGAPFQAGAEARYNQLYAEYRRTLAQRDNVQLELTDVLAGLRMSQLEYHKAEQNLQRLSHDNARLGGLYRQAMNDLHSLQMMLGNYQQQQQASPHFGETPSTPPVPPSSGMQSTSPVMLPRANVPPPPPLSPAVPPATAAAVKDTRQQPPASPHTDAPATPLSSSGRGPSASAGPASLPVPVRKATTKKQQEVQAEQMTKEAYITHLERLIAKKDGMLEKLAGNMPDTVDSAAQACAGTSVGRTQTDEPLVMLARTASSSSVSSLNGAAGGGGGLGLVTDATFDMLAELQDVMLETGFTTLRPLHLLLQNASAAGSSTGGSAARGGGGKYSPQANHSNGAWSARGGNNTATMDRRSSGETDVAAMADSPFHVPESSTPRWADEPVDFDLRPSQAQASSPNKSGRASAGGNDAWKPRSSAGNARTSRTL